MAERDPLDPLTALRAMGEVQRAGLEAAASVVERILEVGRHGSRRPYSFHLPAQPVDGSDSNGAGGRNGAQTPDAADTGSGDGRDADDRARQMRRLRTDGERLLEMWGEWMRVLLDAAMDGAEAGAERNGAAQAGAQALLLGPVKAGERASGSAWLHFLDGPPGPPGHLRATALTAHDGTTIEPGTATFEPPTFRSFDPRSSQELTVSIEVPKGTPPGAYHGHVLAAGLPEVSLPIRLEVSS